MECISHQTLKLESTPTQGVAKLHPVRLVLFDSPEGHLFLSVDEYKDDLSIP